MIDLSNYWVTADEPSADAPIVALTCGTCSQTAGRGDLHWWGRGYSPPIPELVAEAEAHERKEHSA